MTRRLLLAAMLLPTACAGGPEPLRRNYADGSVVHRTPVTVRLSITSAPAEALGTRVQDLEEGPAAAYLEALAMKVAAAEDFRAAAAATIKPPSTGDADRSTLPRTIAIGLSKKGYDATHRLVRADVYIEPVNFSFGGYTLARSLFQSINLENVTLSRTTTASAGLNPEFGGIFGAGEIKASQEQRSVSAYANSEETVALTVDFTPGRVVLLQEGLTGRDLVGQLLISATLKPKAEDQAEYDVVATGMRLQDAQGRDLPPAQASLNLAVEKKRRPEPLLVCARVEYVQRVTELGAEWVDRGRHVIRETRDAGVPALFEIVPADQVQSASWGLSDAGALLSVDGPLGAATLTFTDEIQAGRFANWLYRTGARAIGPLDLYSTSSGRRTALGESRRKRFRINSLTPAIGTGGSRSGETCPMSDIAAPPGPLAGPPTSASSPDAIESASMRLTGVRR